MKIGLAIFFALIVLCQVGFSQEEEKLMLDWADLTRIRTIGDRTLTELIGNVHFTQGDASLRCDRAQQYQESGRTILFGNVVFEDTVKTLFGDKVTYFEESRVAVVEGNAVLQDSLRKLTARKIRFDDIQERAYAFDQVVMDVSKEQMRLTGGHAEYHQQTGYAKVTIDPMVTRADSSKEDSLFITGRVLEMFNDGARVICEDSVRVTRGKMLATCDTLEFLRDEEIINLINSPQAELDKQWITGNLLSLMLHDSEITGIRVVEKAIATTRVDSTIETLVPFDLMTGEDITFYIRNESVDSVRIIGRATSYYHVIENGEERGLNKALGDEMFIAFEADSLVDVTVSSSPSVSNGVFYPPTHKYMIETELLELLNKLKIKPELWDGKKTDTEK